ncbi:RNA-directed DNA polymerase, eukaryota [Tanacetum coccineum]
MEIITMTIKKIADLDNEFDQFKKEFAQHRTHVNERIITMENRFYAELGAIKIELTTPITSLISAAIKKHHEVWMKMLSSCSLPKDEASLRVAPTETYKPVNELPKRPTTIYKPTNDLKGLKLDDLDFPYFAYGDKLDMIKLRNKGPKSKNRFEESRTCYYCKKDMKLKMPLFDGEDSNGWIYKVESMADHRSKEGEVNKISMSIFVTNFPDVTTAKDLWNICNQYGKVIDAFIPNRGTHQPKTKVVNTSSSGGPHYEFGTYRHSNSNVQMAKKGHQTHSMANDLKPALVLDDDCVFDSDFSLSVFGKLKEFDSLPNIKEHASNDFKIDERVTWIDIEDIPLCVWSHNTFIRISSKWGSLLHEEEDEASQFHRKRICIKTTLEDNIFESFKIIVKGKIFWIRAKEVTGWTDFNNYEEALTDTDEDAQSVKDEDILKNDILKVDSEVEEIPKTIFELDDKGDNKSIDDKGNLSVEPKYPPGFTPRHTSKVNSNVEPNSSRGVNEHIKNSHDTVKEPSVMKKVPNLNSKGDVDVSTSSGHFKSVGAPKSSGSILVLMEYLINVGQIIGLAQKAKKDWVKELCLKNKVNLLSLQETKMEQVNLFHIKSCWGNLAFDFVVSPSVGNSGGILCVWDPKMFHKENSTVSDYFIAITGKYVPNDRNLLIISVYAPQELSEKKMLWNYLNHMIDRWKGDVIVMGDFNEVRCQEERFGSIFNPQKSLTLDRFLSDHRPILLCESNFDYGPTPFCFYHSWFEIDGFDSFMEDTWRNINCSNTNPMLRLVIKLKLLKREIRKWVLDNYDKSKNHKKGLKKRLAEIDSILDKGDVSPVILEERMNIMTILTDLENIE